MAEAGTFAGVQPTSGRYAFLFTDIDNSTALWEANPAQMSLAVRLHDEAMRAAIAESEGLIFTTAGDSFSAAFDNCDHALAAALRAKNRLSQLPWSGEPLRVCFALHVGHAEFRDWDFFGPEVIRCARLIETAAPDQIVASASFAAEVLGREGIDVIDLGEYKLEGLSKPEQVVAINTANS